MKSDRIFCVGLLLSIPLLWLLSGCTSSGPEADLQRNNKTNLQRLGNLYCEYQLQNGWEGPDDEESFREFIGGLPSEALELVGIEVANIDGLFVSERDEQPFRIRYEVKGSPYSSQAVVFEEAGVDGVRSVAYTSGQIVEVSSDGEYDRLFTSKPVSDRGENANSGRGIPEDALLPAGR